MKCPLCYWSASIATVMKNNERTSELFVAKMESENTISAKD